jgi:hypothetical protein
MLHCGLRILSLSLPHWWAGTPLFSEHGFNAIDCIEAPQYVFPAIPLLLKAYKIRKIDGKPGVLCCDAAEY